MKRFWVAGLIALLVGCAKESATEKFEGDEYFPPPAPNDVIPYQWVQVAHFGVKDDASYDAFIKVAVKGIRNSSGETDCVLLTSHKRFRIDRPWSPLPFAFYSAENQSEDGLEDLNVLFRDSLDFTDKQSDNTFISTGVTFTRGKAFTARWRFFPHKKIENGTEGCTAYASVEQNSQVECKTDRCIIRDVIAEVDAWRFFTQKSKPLRERDDLKALILTLENVGADGGPEGGSYPVAVPEFR